MSWSRIDRPTMRMTLIVSLGVMIAGLLAALAASPAWALPFTVTKTADTHDGECTPIDCSLREAISEANSVDGRDTIIVPTGTYTLSIPGEDDNNVVGDLDIREEVDIVGAGARTTTVDAAGIDRIFHVVNVRGPAPSVISGFTITGGDPANPPNIADIGGGLLAQGSLTLRAVTVDGNQADLGGGAYLSGPPEAVIRIERSTISNNVARDEAGGLENTGNGGPLTIDNSTIANNESYGDGGGLSKLTDGTTTIKNSTIADNTADSNTDGEGVGGGLAGLADTTFRNTIVARNTDSAGSPDDNCNVYESATTVSQGFNLEDTNTCEFDQPSDDIASPNLGTLANNGGPTDTMALLFGSPAIDSGNADVATDQRGVLRPQNGDNAGSPLDDRGAFERESDTPPTPQCSDGTDNDTDGQTDFPDDPGCESSADASESPDPPPPGCTIGGTSGDDTITGTSGDDTICGLGGNDRIYADSGNDTVRGGDGHDTVHGGAGADTLYGEGNNDTLRGGSGGDDLRGGDGKDKHFGDSGNDSLFAHDGVKGNDLADGGQGTDDCSADKKDEKESCT